MRIFVRVSVIDHENFRHRVSVIDHENFRHNARNMGVKRNIKLETRAFIFIESFKKVHLDSVILRDINIVTYFNGYVCVYPSTRPEDVMT
jgi:hypothetical protein